MQPCSLVSMTSHIMFFYMHCITDHIYRHVHEYRYRSKTCYQIYVRCFSVMYTYMTIIYICIWSLFLVETNFQKKKKKNNRCDCHCTDLSSQPHDHGISPGSTVHYSSYICWQELQHDLSKCRNSDFQKYGVEHISLLNKIISLFYL